MKIYSSSYLLQHNKLSEIPVLHKHIYDFTLATGQDSTCDLAHF